jgi:hypothetical protein
MTRTAIHGIRLATAPAALLAAAVLAAAAAALPASGQDAGAFARNGFGPRGVAMGNALGAVAGASPWYNPALAPFTAVQQLDVSAATLSFDRTAQTVQFATPHLRAGFAVGILHAAVSDIDGRDNAGFHTGMQSVDEFAGYLAFGLRVGSRASAGLALQAFRSDLYDGLDAASTVGIDLGFTLAATDDIRLGLVLDDLLARYSWDSSSLYTEGGRASRDDFPRRVRLAAAMRQLDGRLLVSAEYEAGFSSIETASRRVETIGGTPLEFLDLERITVRDGQLRLGAEGRPVDVLTVRAGIDRIGSGSIRPALGIELDQEIGNLGARFTYTFAREPYGIGSAHYVGLGLIFDRR